MKIIFAVFLSLMFTLMSQNALAQKAGLVLMSKGGVFAIDEQGKKRALRRRSAINEGDTVTTDDKGKLQIRFVDKALLTLKPNSKLDISAYQKAKAEGGNEEVVMNLITGGFRTITGSIGKGEKSAYTVKTPAASIGIRGTNYEVAQETGGNFVMAVWEGGITVSNEQGSLNIGQGGDYNFVRVSPKSEPKGLEKAPDSLKTSTPPPPKKEKPTEEKETEQKSEGDENSDTKKDGDDKEANENQDTESSEQANTAEEESEQVASTDNSDGTETSVEGDAKDSQLEEELDEAQENALAIEEEPLDPLTVESTTDTRFSDFAYTHLLKRPRAALLINNPNVNNDYIGDMQSALVVTSSNTATDPTIVIPGGAIGTDNNVANFTLATSSANHSDYTEKVAGSSFVSWGKWNGSVDVFGTSNSTTSTPTSKDFYWLSAEAASLSSLRGTATFSDHGEHLGDINGESINSLTGQFDVNFTQGKIENGSLNFASGSQTWDMTFDGTVLGSQATMGNIKGNITDNAGTSCTTCVQGNVQGTFARPGDHFVGGMQLQGNEPSHNAQGVFSLKGQRTGN